ncbi:MAG: hypothetical protein RIT14_413 [Pseudomonadota bacterium]
MTGSAAPSVLVTGARGFLGRALVAEFQRRGTRVLTVGAGEDAPDLAAALARLPRPTAVVALSAASPLSDQAAHEALTLGQVLPLLPALGGRCRLVALGSAAEYGAALPGAGLLDEDHPRQPISPYGLAKARLMDEMHRAHDRGADVLGLRLFSAAGPGMSRHSLWGALEAQLREDRRPVVTGPLGGARDILPGDLAARIIATLALAPCRPPAVINLGAGQAMPLRPLVQAVLRHHGPGIDLQETAASEPPTAFAADITRLRQFYPDIAPPRTETLARHIATGSQTDFSKPKDAL